MLRKFQLNVTQRVAVGGVTFDVQHAWQLLFFESLDENFGNPDFSSRLQDICQPWVEGGKLMSMG